MLGDLCDKAKAIISGERQDAYGKPEESFELIAEYWGSYLRSIGFDNQYGFLTGIDVAHMMMLFKIARMSGQKPCKDNYIDLIGYADIGGNMVG